MPLWWKVCRCLGACDKTELGLPWSHRVGWLTPNAWLLISSVLFFFPSWPYCRERWVRFFESFSFSASTRISIPEYSIDNRFFFFSIMYSADATVLCSTLLRSLLYRFSLTLPAAREVCSWSPVTWIHLGDVLLCNFFVIFYLACIWSRLILFKTPRQSPRLLI